MRFNKFGLPFIGIFLLVLTAAQAARAELVVASQSSATAKAQVHSGETGADGVDESVEDEGIHFAQAGAVSGSGFSSAHTSIENKYNALSVNLEGSINAVSIGSAYYGNPAGNGNPHSASYFTAATTRLTVHDDKVRTFHVVYSIDNSVLNDAYPNAVSNVTINFGYPLTGSGSLKLDGHTLNIDAALFNSYIIDSQIGSFGRNGAKTSLAIQWGADFLPGETPKKPYRRATSMGTRGAGLPFDPNDIDVLYGSQSISPVVGSYGLTGSFFSISDIVSGADSSAKANYVHVFSEDINLAAFEIPHEAGLIDHTFTLHFEDFSVPYTPGELFEFTEYITSGVGEFVIEATDGIGFDATIAGLSFVHGYRFMREGVATVTERTLASSVPEPAVALLFAQAILLLAMRRKVTH